jgi:S1-C subfamily serine protease
VQALQPLDVDPLPVGASTSVAIGEEVIMAAGGRRGRAMRSLLQARQEFAGYWEYLLEDALFSAPALPLWSGAAMIDATGALVGIGSLRLEQREDDGRITPFNMSVPAELLAPIYDDLVRGRPIGAPRPWLGVLAQQVGSAVAVVGVSDRGPASRAELRAGDTILRVGGQPVADLAAFYRRLWALGPAGVDVPLTLKRGADVFDVEVRSADRRKLLKQPVRH